MVLRDDEKIYRRFTNAFQLSTFSSTSPSSLKHIPNILICQPLLFNADDIGSSHFYLQSDLCGFEDALSCLGCGFSFRDGTNAMVIYGCGL